MIEVYLKAFINWKQNNWVRLLPIAKFSYNNIKNANIGHILFKLNCRFHLQVLFKENVDSHLKSCSIDKLAKKLEELIEN